MTATDRAYEHTKTRILDGRFESGDLISEGDVAAAVRLSRTPVREAFLRLESEGLLRLYPKRGALVVPISAADVENVMEMRLLIERFAIAQVVERDIDIAEPLLQAIGMQEELAARGTDSRFVQADREFHRMFVVATGNAILLQVHDSMRDRQDRMGLAALSRQADRSLEIVAEHRRMLDAVSARCG
jgi:DNA-binding GntR family transcriptional regulator